MFKEIWSGEPVRLLGIRTAKLSAESEPEQMTLFDMELPQPPDEKHQRLNAAMRRSGSVMETMRSKGKPDEKDGRKERRKEEKEREIRTREMNERKE